MFSTARVSRSSFKRVTSPGFYTASISSTRTVKILRTPLVSCFYSTFPSASTETPLSALPPLPEESEWRQIFNRPGSYVALRDRVSIRNPKTARALAESFTNWTKPLREADKVIGKGRSAKGAPKVIIEAFPGTLGLLLHVSSPPY